MQTHVKIVAWIYIIGGLLGILGGIFFIFFAGESALLAETVTEPGEAEVLPAAVGLTGATVGIISIIVSFIPIIGGWGLLKYANWARILVIILSIINLFNFPIGTIVGIYALWVLFKSETKQLFDHGHQHVESYPHEVPPQQTPPD